MKKWLIFAASCLGLAALCLIIWYIFPVVAIADVRPFAGVWLRLALVMLAVTLFCGFHAYCYYRKRSASAALAGAIAAQAAAEPDSDAKQLAEKMADAIQTLRKSHKTKGDFLYELPWYIIIGPPGAGKTTALLNSGLKFPLLSGKERRPVSGAGGTRYCDWWFTEDAVLIDTAGRYTTQDSDASTDRRSWQVFLGLLKKHRPLQPINGVLVAISLADIVNLPDDEIGRHCAAIRKRLDDLHQTLNIAYPVYVVFTKADLVPGFSEYFANLGEQRRKMVWGTTFRVKNKSENPVGEAGDEFDLLVDRLTQEMPDRLQEEGDPVGRVKIYGFPSQMGALRKPVVDFLDQVFEPTRYQTSIPLRGFYFTSGTQEGTPIDRLLGAMAGMSARQAGAAPALSGRAKSYFLGDLLTKVIFGEAGWVSANKTETRRKHMLRYLGYGGAAVACLAGLGLFAISYEINNELIRVTETGLVQYRSDAKDYLAQDVISSDDFTEPMGALTELRQLTAGYGNRDVAPQLGATFGLSQKERLTSSTTAAYHVALDRMLRPRLVLHMEKKLEANLNDPLVIYEALKVYLMLGKEDNVPVDRDYVLGYLGNEWNNTEGKANAKAREEFLGHAAAMLDLNTGGGVPIALNGSLVEEAQKILARLSLADRAYALLKSNAESSDGVDWNVGEHGGPDVETVFETTDGSDLKALHIPRFFTYDGFHRLFLDKLGEYAGQLDNESWVLGPIAQQSLVKSQLATLRDNLIDKYSADFIKAWTAALAQLRMKRLAFDKSDYATLGAITGGASPLRQLIEAVATETKLTTEPPA